VAAIASSKNVAGKLIDYVRREGYAPGTRLPPIRQLAATLGVGRNVVRDALLEAQTLGLVRIEPRLGVFVQAVAVVNGEGSIEAALDKALGQEEQNLFHLVEARLVVEAELAGQAAARRRPEDLLPLRQTLADVLDTRGDRLAFIRADEAFHLAIAQIAANRVLLVFLQTLWRLISPAKSNLPLSSESRQVSDREHQELFQNIVAGDADAARTIMRDHIGRGRELLLDYARTVPGPGTNRTSSAKARSGGKTS
jgi:GntR family transcriptional repressor for pyruvate dehydrogenase complex